MLLTRRSGVCFRPLNLQSRRLVPKYAGHEILRFAVLSKNHVAEASADEANRQQLLSNRIRQARAADSVTSG